MPSVNEAALALPPEHPQKLWERDSVIVFGVPVKTIDTPGASVVVIYLPGSGISMPDASRDDISEFVNAGYSVITLG